MVNDQIEITRDLYYILDLVVLTSESAETFSAVSSASIRQPNDTATGWGTNIDGATRKGEPLLVTCRCDVVTSYVTERLDVVEEFRGYRRNRKPLATRSLAWSLCPSFPHKISSCSWSIWVRTLAVTGRSLPCRGDDLRGIE